MNYGALIFLAAFLGISASWFGFVLTPQIQIGREMQATNTVNTAELYPVARPGIANEGLEVYRANGCVYCHSQQIGQGSTRVDFVLSNVGTNVDAVAEALRKANIGLTNANAAGLGAPKVLLSGTTIANAKKAAKAVKDAGGEGRVEIKPVGADIARGWGVRHSVAQDYIYDSTVMLGSQRVGPDLSNVGLRSPDVNWHLRHLYAPQIVEGSAMPSYKFLFEQRKIGARPSPDALQFTSSETKFAPKDGYEIVPKPEAKALVAYLLSLHSGAPLFEAPLSVAAAPAAATATNSPAK